MIRISNLSAGYEKENVLHQISLCCEKGKITTLVGPNGCGKSTLLKTIVGMLPIREGEALLEDVQLGSLSKRARAQRIAYLSQGKNLPDITVERMVLHGRFPYLSYPRKYRLADYEKAHKAMAMMGVEEYADKLLCTLSGGMRQKVYLAMALCQEADVILMDEPATYLDISQQIKMYELCRRLADEGKTILMVSHDLIAALKHSDHIVVMKEGHMMSAGAPAELLETDVIRDCFGVEAVAFVHDGETEYFYKKGAIEQ
jgi:iron complex transport system ATP-binding protein